MTGTKRVIAPTAVMHEGHYAPPGEVAVLGQELSGDGHIIFLRARRPAGYVVGEYLERLVYFSGVKHIITNPIATNTSAGKIATRLPRIIALVINVVPKLVKTTPIATINLLIIYPPGIYFTIGTL